MSGPLCVVAMDLDDTLTTDGDVSPTTIDALERAHDDGVSLILVSRQSAATLEPRLQPRLRGLFDAVVSDDGEVLHVDAEPSAPPVIDEEFVLGLRCLEAEMGDGHELHRLVAGLGRDLQVAHHDASTTVPPGPARKASGLSAALHVLGLSRHNVVALGSDMSDLDLFDGAEVNVALADCDDAVRSRADLVLDDAGQDGLSSLLSQLSGGSAWAGPAAQVTVGHESDGTPVDIPAARATLVIEGPGGSGKSHLAGLLVEQWCELGYRVLVLDFEGDYLGLRQRSDVVVLSDPMYPDPSTLIALLRYSAVSVVIDLAQLGPQERADYLADLGEVVAQLRSECGLPHWVVIDEARAMGTGHALDDLFAWGGAGLCLVTQQPWALPFQPDPDRDVILSVRAGEECGHAQGVTLRARDGRRVAFTPEPRRTPHLRRWHSFSSALLPEAHWFWFTAPDGARVAVARTVREFCEILAVLPDEVVLRHLDAGDISRWLHALALPSLAKRVDAVEIKVALDGMSTERAREHLIAAAGLWPVR